MALSDAAVRNLKPREMPYKVSDFNGLFVRVKPTGSRLWQFKYRLNGKEKLLSIGPYPETSLADARSKRDAARMMVAKGIDPSEVKQEQKRRKHEASELTFALLAGQYIDKVRQEGRPMPGHLCRRQPERSAHRTPRPFGALKHASPAASHSTDPDSNQMPRLCVCRRQHVFFLAAEVWPCWISGHPVPAKANPRFKIDSLNRGPYRAFRLSASAAGQE